MFSDITRLIESHEDVEYAIRKADAWEWIGAAEMRIGYNFPPSLRWMLNRYVAIEVRRLKFCGVHEPGTEDKWVGDIIRCCERMLEEGLLSSNEIWVCDDDFGGFFYLDTSMTEPVRKFVFGVKPKHKATMRKSQNRKSEVLNQALDALIEETATARR